MANLLFEVTVLNGSTPLTLRMASASATPAGVQLNGYQWLPLITKRHSTAGSWAQDGVFSQGEINHQSISFRIGATHENEAWSAYEWNGALGRVFVQTGEEGDFSTYKQVFEGSVSSLDRQAAIATVGLLGPDATLNRPLLSAEYSGSGSAEGDVGLKGTLKPFAVGNAQSVEPILVDAAHWIYQVHGYGSVASITPYEFAQLLDPARNKGNHGSYIDLANAPLVPGEWATCYALGMFRLGGTPSKKVSADVVVGSSTSTQIIRDLLLFAGVPAAKISTLTLSQSGPWSYYTTEQITVGELARMAAFHSAGVLFADGTGTWRVMDYLAEKTPVVLKADRSATPLVKDYRELNSAAPIYKVRVGYDPCWGVHGANDISPTLLDRTQMEAFSEALEAAKSAADEAAAQAQAAIDRLTAISDDNVLDRSDKAITLRELQGLLAEQPSIAAQATGLGVTSERDLYVASIDTLRVYLESLNPAYTDLEQDTPINGAEFRQKFVDVYSTRQTLWNKIVEASTYWRNISGEGKPQDFATVGAPSGTPVGNSTADEVVDRINAAHDTIDIIDERTNGIIAKLGDLPNDATVAQALSSIGVAADLGGNLLNNSDFASSGDKAAFPGWGLVTSTPDQFYWGVDNANQRVQGTRYMGLLCQQKNGDFNAAVVSDWVAVEPGKWIQISAWLAARECTATLVLQWGADNDTYLRDAATSETIPANAHFGTNNLDGWKRVWTKAQVPTDARFARLVFGKGLYLALPGRNDLSWAFMLRPQLCLAAPEQTEPSPYRPAGGGAGLTAAQAYIKNVETVAAGAGAAAAQVKSILAVDAGGQSARLNTVEQVAATAFDRVTGARWSKEAVAGNGRAQLTVYAFDKNGNTQAGVDIIGNVTISGDLTVDGTIRTSKLAGNAAQSVQFVRTSDQTFLPSNQTTRVVQLTFEKFVQESSIDLVANLRMRSTDDIQGQFRVMNLNNGATEDNFPIWMVGAGSNFQVPIALNWIATGWAPGVYTIAIDFFRQEPDGQMFAEAGSIIKVHEIKR